MGIVFSVLCVCTVIRNQIRQLSLNCILSQVAEANTDDACMQIIIAKSEARSPPVGESTVHLSFRRAPYATDLDL